MRLIDAHNHLQDARFAGRQEDLLRDCREVGVIRMVVNGTGEEDWPAVAELARRHPDLVIPAFGLHPWQVGTHSPDWKERLVHFLESCPGAMVGEIGLDRWMLDEPERWRAHLGPRGAARTPASVDAQRQVFREQLELAREGGRPASIHCLRGWGLLQEALGAPSGPGTTFLLHSYGGPAELVPWLARRGAFFSCSGWFLQPRKRHQLEVFQQVPPDRLLVETDAPDQPLPDAWRRWPAPGRPAGTLNHPANLEGVYRGLADALGQSVEELAVRMEQNFAAFARIVPSSPSPG